MHLSAHNICFWVHKYYLLKEKKSSKAWSKDLMYEKIFRFLSHTPGDSFMSCQGIKFILACMNLNLKPKFQS